MEEFDFSPENLVFSKADHVHIAVKIFTECVDLNTRRDEIAGELKLSQAQIHEIRDQNLKPYIYFGTVLSKWISQEGERPTWAKLIAALRNLKFNSVADEMLEQCKKLMDSRYSPERPTGSAKSPLQRMNSSTSYQEASLPRGGSTQFSFSTNEVASFLLDCKVKEAYDVLKLTETTQAEKLIEDLELMQSPMDKRGEILSKFIASLIELGKFDIILNTCTMLQHICRNSTFSCSESEQSEIECHKGWALIALTRFDEAVTIFQNAYRNLTRVLTENSVVTMEAKIGYAFTLSELDKNKESNEHLQDAIKILDAQFPTHEVTLKAKMYHAIVIFRLGNPTKALDMCREVNRIQRRTELDGLHTIESQYYSAFILTELKRFEEAHNLLDEVQKNCERLHLKLHPVYLRTSYKLAQTYSSLGNNNKAEEILKEAIQHINDLGQKHEDALKIRRFDAQVCFRLGRYTEGLNRYEAVYKLQSATVGFEHPSTLETKYQMAILLTSLKRYDEALRHLSEVQRAQNRNLGETHYATMRTESDIGAIQCELGNQESGLDSLHSVIRKQETKLDKKHPDLLRSRRFLAQNHSRIGEYDEAVEILKSIRPIQEANTSIDHPTYLETGFHLGVAYKLSRRFDEALGVLEKVLSRQSATLGPLHPLALTTRNEIAIIYSDQGDQEKARKLLEPLIPVGKTPAREGSELSELDLLVAQRYFGQVLYRTDRPQEAVDLLQKVEEEQERLIGTHHPAVLETKYQIALALIETCDYNKALKLLHEIDRIQASVLGKSHPATFRTKVDLARVYSDLGENKESLKRFREAEAEVQVQQFKFAEADKLRMNRYKARTQSRLGDFEKALTTLKAIEGDQRKILPPGHPSLIETKYQIGQVYKSGGDRGDMELARNMFKEVLKFQLQNGGKEKDCKVLRTQVSIAGISLILGEIDASSLDKLIKSCESNLGIEHQVTLTVKRYKAQSHTSSSKFPDAITLFNEVLEAQSNKFGDHHPITLETMYQMGICLERKGDFESALKKFQRVLIIGGESCFSNNHPFLLRTRNRLHKLQNPPPQVPEPEKKKKHGFFSKKSTKL